MQIIFSLLMTLTLGFSMLQCAKMSAGGGKNVAQSKATPTAAPPAANPNPGDEAPRISLADAKKDFDDNAAIFVDTRQKPSYESEHIKGSINFSADMFEAHYQELPKDKKIIAYCS